MNVEKVTFVVVIKLDNLMINWITNVEILVFVIVKPNVHVVEVMIIVRVVGRSTILVTEDVHFTVINS